MQSDLANLNFVVIDTHAKERKHEIQDIYGMAYDIIVDPPKPSVWQGPHRLTKEDWFAKANACNTALCLAPDGWIAYVDDLCVLAPTWMQAVRDAMAGNYILYGSYKKCLNMVVKDGVLESYDIKGNDSRLPYQNGDVSECPADTLYGCSFAAPVEALLEVNGWDENCDGLGSEDSILGVRLGNLGKYQFKFDKRMTTYESEEGHEPKGSVMRRSDYGVSPNDKSHAILAAARATTYAPNYFDGGIRKLREHVLAGGSFPIMKVPEHEWFTGTPLKDL